MNDVKVIVTSGLYSKKYGGNFDLRPSFSLEKGLFESKIPAFYAKGVKNLELNDISLGWNNPKNNFFTNGLEIENFENFILRNFKINAAYNKEELFDVKMSNGKNYKLLNNLSSTEETRIKHP